MTNICDTKEGIEESLKSLAYFEQLLADRNKAAKTSIPLNTFIVLGRYDLDEFGCCGKIKEPIKELFPSVPDVISHEEFGKFLTKQNRFGFIIESIPSGKPLIAPANIPCQRCGKQWTIDDCHDIEIVEDEETITYYHGECYKNSFFEIMYKIFSKIFYAAGVTKFQMTPMPADFKNEKADSWFLIDTELASFCVGLKDRGVYLLLGEGEKSLRTQVPDLNLFQLFPEENTIKNENTLCAYTYDDATRYLKTFYSLYMNKE